MRPIPLIVLTLSIALPLTVIAQIPDSSMRAPAPPATARGATVSGVVRDSVARRPLPGALVQIVADDDTVNFSRSIRTDSLGRFSIADVPDGKFTIGFLHPLLDSLGIEAPLRAVTVDRHRAVRVDLAIPSPARIRDAICGPRTASDTGTGAVVVGVVRGARDRTPLAGVTVTGEWLELTFRSGGIDRRRPRLSVTTAANGWFALCDVPRGGTMLLTAVQGADSTDRIEAQVPPDGLLRHELYLGSARSDSASPPNTARIGDGTLRGTVVTADGARPLPGARIRVSGGRQVFANERGEWTLTDAPSGSRMLEVRAIGYYPEFLPVEIIAAAPPVPVALTTFKQMLETVHVTARRVADPRNSGFEERRLSGAGRYLTAEDVARRGGINASDILARLSGLRKGFPSDTLGSDVSPYTGSADIVGDRLLLMRGLSGRWCAPSVYVDGLFMPNTSGEDIDGWVTPQRIAGIELYTEATVPANFQRSLAGCGALVIWTK